VITTELKAKKTNGADAKKRRVLIEFEAGTEEFSILTTAEEKGYSIAATLRTDVSNLVKEMGTAMGIKPKGASPKPKA
jgi:hypothetical protein